MNSLKFAQMMAESRKRNAQTKKSSLPPPPKVIGTAYGFRLVRSFFLWLTRICCFKDGANKKLHEESAQPTPSGATEEKSDSPSTQPPKTTEDTAAKGRQR